MKYFIYAALLAALGVPAVVASPPNPNPVAPPTRLKSPEILTDGRVTFRLNGPNATTVTLNGSWLGATDLPMTKDASGVWSTTVGPLSPQEYGYWYIVDGL